MLFGTNPWQKPSKGHGTASTSSWCSLPSPWTFECHTRRRKSPWTVWLCERHEHENELNILTITRAFILYQNSLESFSFQEIWDFFLLINRILIFIDLLIKYKSFVHNTKYWLETTARIMFPIYIPCFGDKCELVSLFKVFQ